MGNKDIDIIPAEIVKSLYGIGLNPAIKDNINAVSLKVDLCGIQILTS